MQNRDIAEMVSERTGGECLVPRYDGLGHAPGVFRFDQCLENVRNFYRGLVEQSAGQPIHVVGHSWGGFLTLLLASEFPGTIGHMVLMSPLLHLKDSPQLKEVVLGTIREHPELDFGDPLELLESYLRVGQSHSVEAMVASVPASVSLLFLQAKNDPVTMDIIAQKMLPSFKCQVDFRFVDCDHSFIGDRRQIAEQIAAHLLS